MQETYLSAGIARHPECLRSPEIHPIGCQYRRIRLQSTGIGIFLLLFFFAALCFSQSYLVHHYTESNGLPNSMVFDIAQDKQGRIWFATQGGIAVYDGVYWKRFSVSEGLPVTSFYKIKIDGLGRVWALAEPGQQGLFVVYFEKDKWQHLPPLPEEANSERQITSFALMSPPPAPSPGQDKTPAITVAVGTKHMGLLVWAGSGWEQYPPGDGLIGSRVNEIISWEGKWLVATDKGLAVVTIHPHRSFEVDRHWDSLLRHALPPGASREIKALSLEYCNRFPGSALRYHRIWLTNGQWIGYIENDTFKMVYHWPGFDLPSNQEQLGIFPDYQNGVYLSSRIRNYYFNRRTGTMETIGISSGLIDEGAYSIFIDFEKNVWIASRRGVSKIASRRFGSFQMNQGLLEDEVTAVLEYEPGKLVFGHNNGLTLFDSSRKPRFVPHPLKSESGGRPSLRRILDIKLDSKKNIWVVFFGPQLIEINVKNGVSRRYGPRNGLPTNLLSLWIDPDDTRWVGTSQGVYRQQNQARLYFAPFKEGDLIRYPVRRILRLSPLKNKQRGIYFATAGGGIFGYADNTLSHYLFPGDNRANDVFAMMEDSRGRFLLGTLGGLYRLRDGEVERFVSRDFRIERPVYFIVEDHHHHFWFGTDNGVVRWDGEGKRSIHYTTSEGLIGLETNRAGGLVDSLGRLWIGTNRGVSLYNPSFDSFNTSIQPPRLSLTALEVTGKRIPLVSALDQPVQLTYRENNVVFQFRGISFLDETRVRFKAKLEGFDQQWSEELYPYNQAVRYRNLPPGRYRFYLKAKNALGIWSQTVTSPVIHIGRPFYRTWWFYLLIGLGAAAILSAVYRYFARERYSLLLSREIKERTRQLKATEEKYTALFQDIKDAVYISSPEGKLMDFNPAGMELFGFVSREEYLNVDIARDLYVKPQERHYFKKAIEEKGFVKNYEISVKRRSGETLTVVMTATAVRDEQGQITAYRGIMRDITERKKLERQLERAQKMEAIGMLAGGVAHDLNNILTGLTSYPELLLMQIPQDSPLRKPMLTIKQTGEKAAAMVQDLLTLSRRGVEVREVVNLNDVIQDYLESPECEKLKAYHLDARIDANLDSDLLNILGSPIHLFKSVMNLVSNAVEAMPHGGMVCVSTENRYIDMAFNGYDTVREGEYVLLSVTDTGVGISPEEVSRIFEPFYTRKEMGRSGTGLGMSVVWATAKDHCGYIDVISQKGKGTTFDLYFPVTRKETPQKEAPQTIEKYMGREKILIIDDIEEQREVACGILDRLGYRASAVASGEEAIEYLKGNSFDLLIIDMIMEKGIDGLETYRRIHQLWPGQKAIIVSGFSKTEKVKEMQRLGAGCYLKKPYTIEQIGRAIRCELDTRPGEDSR